MRTLWQAMCVGGALLALVGWSDHAAAATAEMKDAEGKTVGTVELKEVPSGVLLHAEFEGLMPGTHAFHIHAVGKCEPPFTSAGGHYNPDDAKHGLLAENGPHVGDMPNIHVPDSGMLEIEVFNNRLALDDALFDGDGAAIVIHEGPDDYETDPAGAAGPRIACGVIQK